MHILGFNKRRTLALGLAVALLVGGAFALLGSFRTAQSTADVNPNNTVCRGHIVALAQDPAEPDQYPVRYRFRCNQAISGFSLFLDGHPADTVETEAFPVTLSGAPIAGGDLMSCGGTLPGYGINCVGAYTKTYGIMTGSFSLPMSACAEPRLEPIMTVTTAYLSGSPAVAKAAVSGPFSLGKPLNCVEPKTKAEKRRDAKLRQPLKIPVEEDTPVENN